jgi:hypothetical protein
VTFSAANFKRIRTQQRLWKALRVQKTCDANILGLSASASPETARQYLGLLVRAGYVEIVERGNGQVGKVNRYRLVKDTGPRAPRRVFDFLQDDNVGEMTALAAAQNNRRPNLGGGNDGRIIEKARLNMLRAGAA